MANSARLLDTIYTAEMFRSCEQCGRCSAACPITGINGFNVRRLIRHIELDLIDEIAASRMPWFCAVCGRCEDACPNGIKILTITRSLRAMAPPERWPADEPPCMGACPAGIDIPGYLRLIAQGQPDEACALIMEKAPLPGILGRVCPRPCETACKRGEVNQPVAICAAKRFAADATDRLPARVLETQPDSGRRVAVIGSGPAGLTCAFFLRKKGHRVTIFEARPNTGGMLRYGIPAYRLPDDVLTRDIERLLDVGIEVRTGIKFGKDIGLEDLKSEGCEAVFVAVGAQLSKKLSLDGAQLEGVLWGVDFLTRIRDGQANALKPNVMVIGGGSVAVDVALSALRLGAAKVTLACLESRSEMPAQSQEIQTALEEGIEMLYSWGPKRIIGTNGAVSAVELVRCTQVFDAEGHFCPYFDDAHQTVAADQVILAIGQASETEFCKDFCFLDEQASLPVQNGLIVIDRQTQRTPLTGVFAGGDAANGPGTVVEAMSAGRRAAAAIDRFLGGDGILVQQALKRAAQSGYSGQREKGFAEIRRVEMPRQALFERKAGFKELELGLSGQAAREEARRCLQCDLERCLAQEQRCRKS